MSLARSEITTIEALVISPNLLAGFFFVVAFLYSSVGLGGGTSYAALLAVFGASHRVIPPVTLTLNIVVAFIGAINFVRAGHARMALIAPLVVTSVPMAYLGASIEVEATVFYGLMIAVLVLVLVRFLLASRVELAIEWDTRWKLAALVAIGAIIGFLSGLVGIGGGIFLVPLIVIFGLGDLRVAGATGAIFIFLNSVSGLTGHLQRNVPDLEQLLGLVVAVVVGGSLGSYMGARKWTRNTIQRFMALVVLVAIILLSYRLI